MPQPVSQTNIKNKIMMGKRKFRFMKIFPLGCHLFIIKTTREGKKFPLFVFGGSFRLETWAATSNHFHRDILGLSVL